MNPAPDDGGGPRGDALGLTSRVVQLLATRLELFAFEFSDERRSLVRAILVVIVAAGLGVLALVLLTFSVILAIAPDWRPLAALIAAFLYAGIAAWMLFRLRRFLQERPPPFTATLEELQRDRQWLRHLK